MHALSRWIQDEMDARHWRQRDLVRESGLARSQVSQLLTQPELRRMVAPNTVSALAKAFGVDERIVIVKSAEAIGVPVDLLSPVVVTAWDVSNEELLAIISSRLSNPSGLNFAPNRSYAQPGFSGENKTAPEPGTLRPPGREQRRGDDDRDLAESEQQQAGPQV